jgi:glycosyltransferase involved in cell wall biosynthesis
MPPRLRVLFINEGALRGGPIGKPRVEAAIRIGLEGVRDVDAHFVSLPPIGTLAHSATRGFPGLRDADLDLAYMRWHLVYGARTRRVARRALAEFPADVLYVVGHAIALLMRTEMRRVPTVLSVDATVLQVREMELDRPLRRLSRASLSPSIHLERRALDAAALVLCRSEWARAGVLEACPSAETAVLSPGIDLEKFHPAPHRKRDLPRILFVGAHFGPKGGYDLLEAVRPMLGRTVELDVVAHDPPEPRPGLRVHSLGPGDPRLIDLFQQCDLFCLASHGDAFGWVILEALACGAPVVATRVGAIPELLDGGALGALVPVRDPEAIRSAIETLLAHPERLRDLRVRAREWCELHQDARVQTPRLIQLMRGLRPGPRE